MSTQNRPTQALPRSSGDLVTGKKFNAGMEAIERLIPGVNPPSQVRFKGGAAQTGLEGQHFIVVEILPDYLVCNPYDGINTDTETRVYVARTPNTRGSETTWNGVAYSAYTTDGQERTSTLAGNVETEVLVRPWIVGAKVFAQRGFIGGTGVTYVGVDGQTYNVEWLVCSDGQMWARKNGT